MSAAVNGNQFHFHFEVVSPEHLLDANSGRVMQFLIWSKNYQWPSDLKL